MLNPWIAAIVLPALAAAGGLAMADEPKRPGQTLNSEDGYVRPGTDQWTFGTAFVEKTVALRGGRLLVTSLRNQRSGREMAPAGREVEDLSPAGAGAGGEGGWKLEGSAATVLAQGELRLDLKLSRGPLLVTKTYVVYPGTSVIREHFTCRNRGDTPLRIVEPRFFGASASLGGGLPTLDLHWMTGARNEPGCWTLRTLKPWPRKPEVWDSYDPFPGHGGRITRGDGVDVRITLNGRQVWPASGWQFCPGDRDQTFPFDVPLDVQAGDRVEFIVDPHGQIGYDTTDLDPTIAWEGGEARSASDGFSGKQGAGGWHYGCLVDGQWSELVYSAAAGRWQLPVDTPTHTPFIAARCVHPGEKQPVVRRWTADRAGRLRATGVVCNVGNAGIGMPTGGHRMASESYAPWHALRDRSTGDGLVIGWDYMGHWTSRFVASADGAVEASLHLAGYRGTLAPGEEMTTPPAFLAAFRGDLDEAGNELLDWQYRYLWDYTREGWFPAIPMLGNWFKGTGWGEPGAAWWGTGRADIPSQFTKIFRAADLIRAVGGDLYHRDWGWWDRAGDWNGPDFGASARYLRKYGMGQVIYAFLYTVDPQSKLAREHGDWLIGQTLDMSLPPVVEHLGRQLDDFHARWGDFAWRNDSTPTAPRGGDDTPLLAQDQNFRAIIRRFLDKYPRSSFQSVNGGGNEAGYDYLRLSGMFQFADGVANPLRNYYASLLFPPDKLMDNGDSWRPERFDKATWRGLLSMGLMVTGDTWDKSKLEGVRELFDIYHYLASQGVVGRWVKVYRPAVDGDDPAMYLQRLSRDRLRGLIVPTRSAPGKVTLRPKGLLPDAGYRVTFQESQADETRTGRSLMEGGITLDRMAPGELIYLNLPMHPGSRLDRQPPTAPAEAARQWAENMGHGGVELTWRPATDDNWVSFYEVLRDGVAIGKVAKGTYFFDHSAGADLAAKYEIVAVDGSGNRSPAATVAGAAGRPAQVIDDADEAVAYNGAWRHGKGLEPAHRETIASADEKGASVRATVEGRRVLWFSKLGDDCGRALVSIDDGPAETVDTYCSDDVWGVCVFARDLPSPGRHTIRITVAGTRNDRSKGTRVHFDGLRCDAPGR